MERGVKGVTASVKRDILLVFSVMVDIVVACVVIAPIVLAV
jgi:hypothetical protein